MSIDEEGLIYYPIARNFKVHIIGLFGGFSFNGLIKKWRCSLSVMLDVLTTFHSSLT